MCRVGIQVPTLEIRYENVTVDAKCVVGDRALPTLQNATINTLVVKIYYAPNVSQLYHNLG
jgi:hypothetical protein